MGQGANNGPVGHIGSKYGPRAGPMDGVVLGEDGMLGEMVGSENLTKSRRMSLFWVLFMNLVLRWCLGGFSKSRLNDGVWRDFVKSRRLIVFHVIL